MATTAAPREPSMTQEQLNAHIAELKNTAKGVLSVAIPVASRPAPLETLAVTPENIEAVKAAMLAAMPPEVTLAATDTIYFTVEGYPPLILKGVATQAFVDAISTVAVEVYNLTRGTVYKSAKYEKIKLLPKLTNELSSDPTVRLMSQDEAVVRLGLKL